jgi:TrmH family RNA methyltransferase
MANFGVEDLRVVAPYEVAFREAVSAVGGVHVLKSARVFDTVAEAVADCSLVVGTTAAQHRELQQPIELIQNGTAAIREHSGRVALLFGSEKFGLSNEDMSYCHALVRIPTVPDTPSMNLGQAVAVCLYEIHRSESARPRVAHAEPEGRRNRLPHHEPIEGSDAELLTRMLLEVLEKSGYTNRITSTSTEQKVRRWMRRVQLTRRDAPLLLGILRQILWKFGK